MNKFAKKSLSAACAVVLLSSFTVNVYAGSLPESKGSVSVTQVNHLGEKNDNNTLFNSGRQKTFTGAQELVSGFYTHILGRSGSQEEIDGYANMLESGTAVASVVNDFFNSGEFVARNTSDDEYVKILYRALFGREAGESEVSFHVENLWNGVSRYDVRASFIAAQEYRARCEVFGLAPGEMAGDGTPDAPAETDVPDGVNVEGLRGFVRRLYSKVHGRNCSEAELAERVDQLLSGGSTGNAGHMAYEFFNSPEYRQRNVNASNPTEEYIVALYNVMFDRNPGTEEIEYYRNRIDNLGHSRNLVLSNFVTSPEFAAVCAGYGVSVGEVPLSSFDTNPEIGQFVRRQYINVLGRSRSSIGDFEIHERIDQLLAGTGTAQMTFEFFNSPEFKGRKLSNEEYIRTLYTAILGRKAAQSEVDEYLDVLAHGATRNYLFVCFINSPEFASICAGYGLVVGEADVHDVVGPTYNPTKDDGSKKDDEKDKDDDQDAWDNENLTVRFNGKNVTDTVENILVQTVYAEVGGFRNTEVYKAQAVAAYTFIRYHNSRGSFPNLPLSAPPSGVNSDILAAVRSVKGQSITYNGALAQTTYYAMSSGSTNNSSDIWKTNIPYLVSVDSKYDVNATNHKATKTFTMDEFIAIMDSTYGGRTVWRNNVGDDPSKWITTNKNAGGYVTSINLCGRTPSPEYFYQTMFGLRSPAFDVSYDKGSKSFVFTTYGYGHGVGMSQWGAYYYAVNEGWSYEQILAHYYPGTTLKKK